MIEPGYARDGCACRFRSESPAELLSGVSVVVPVYNSEATLSELVARLLAVLEARQSPFELVLVNDGSRDRSWETIVDLAAEHRWIVAIDLMRNYGQHNALLVGIRAARFEAIVTMDDDLQHPPEEIPKLLSKLADGYDVVYGAPSQEQHGLPRDLASRITKLALQSAIGAETARNVTAFRAFRTQVREAFAAYRSPYVSIDVLLTWATGRFGALTVQHGPRAVGRSNYTFRDLIVHALNMLTGFSIAPLRAASLAGFGCALFGLFVLCFVLGRYALEGGSVPGFPFLASVIAIFSGAQLFALGLIGEYLARMHFRSMDKPPYAVRQRIGQEHS